MKRYIFLCVGLLHLISVQAWFSGDPGKKVLLKDVQALTLHSGQMTKGRRSAAVPQLECVTGGNAPCSAFKPRVVQCHNKGFDGIDVQWECKTDMDSNIRFGHIDVSCEGYDYPEDPYILAGSCGLRYSLDYSKDGYKQHHDYGYGQHEHYDQGDSYGWSDSVRSNVPTKSRGFMSGIADLISYCALGLMAWAFYKTCISPTRGTVGDRSDSYTNDDYPAGGGGGGGYGWNLGNGGGGTGGGGYGPGYDDASCHRGRRAGGGGGGGFWTGAAAGGLLGYMLGGNRRGAQYNGGYNRGWGGGGWGGGGGGWGGGGGGSSFGGGGGGTRTASGFGGTSRR